MKIVYLFTSPSLKGSSVQTKVLNQIKYLNVAGADCRGAFFSTEVNEISKLNEYADLIPVKPCNRKYFRASAKKNEIMKSVLAYAEMVYRETDYFYFRYPGAGQLLKVFTDKYGSKTIFEHLSNEIAEIKLQKEENPFGLNPSDFLSHLEYVRFPLWREWIYGPGIRRKSRLGVCNSSEIAQWQTSVAAGNYPTFVSGDAVDTSAYSLRKMPLFTNELNLVFLKGASGRADFNGLDRLINGMSAYKGKTDIKLHILGHQLDYEKSFLTGEMSNHVILHPAKTGNELEEFLSKMHIGVATLGLYRKHLQSTTTLKVREYCAIGLPFIYAYTDPDLHEESRQFCRQFPNDDTVVSMEAVLEFANDVLNRADVPEKMRHYSETYMDYRVKMKKLYFQIQNL